MKRIACLNTLSITSEDPKASQQLVDIFNDARLYNKAQDIKGVILVAKDVVLQILEGDASTLGKALYKLSRDTHTQNASIIMNSQVDKPLFNSWRIKFFNQSNEKNEIYLKNIYQEIKQDLDITSDNDQARLDNFFNFEEAPQSIDNLEISITGQFAGLELSLKAWPKPSQFKPTPDLLRLCTLLSKKPTGYDSLKAMGLTQSDRLLDEYLERLKGNGLLELKPMPSKNDSDFASKEPAPIKTGTDASQAESGDRFSNVLRKFIASARKIRQ